ncbi:MBL fold metallo-hydrolase [Chitinolyticbacter meiyuanensis]|uniref:MBL fold metallo-hydrolase n=1 Tax=Chitinolyticbacter meiyuanensis TaxID=682798 RepID=UPI0011E5EBB8|nr:MBL fold metallo-hydrolase [Chitinolyticbacter meiyuanensis]
MPRPHVISFFDPQTATFSYLVYDHPGGAAALVDPVLDFDPRSGHTASTSAQRLVDQAQALGLTVQWILETHAHADHLSAAAWLRERVGGRIAIGRRITEVQRVFKLLYGLECEFMPDGRQFDVLFDDDACFEIGSLQARALFVPGHTPADMAYLVEDALFAGDTLFPPDVGTARCDFPGGDAGRLFDSVQRLYRLPDSTRFYACHDYPPAGRTAVAGASTIAEQKARNIHINSATRRDDFIAMRTARDAGLAMPQLILPALQVNIRAGLLPEPEPNGTRYLKIPLNQLGKPLP